MNEFRQIPVTVLPDSEDEVTITGTVRALLQELMDMVIALVETGATNVIDLKSLPLAPGELEQLRLVLGEGEVEAIVNALGPSHIQETMVPGIWWITHKNSNDEVVAEFIEVTSLPEILLTQHEEVWNSVDVLKGRIEEFDADP